jgi:hypothetical protein
MALASGYGAKRLTDFSTGRYCLRQSTSPLGYAGEILIGDRGMPLLPGHITATLSHSRNLCGAIAARKSTYLSLGMDIETRNRVHEDMWKVLFTPGETAFLNRQTEAGKRLYSTIFFSLKEAFYKLQYPLTGVFIDFAEVEIFLLNNRLYARLLRQVSNLFPAQRVVQGSVFTWEEEVVTWCALPARSRYI